MLQRQHQQQEAPPLTQHEDFLEGESFLRYTAPRLVRGCVRADSLRAAGEFGSIFTDDEGNTRSYASLLPAALKHTDQLEREELPGYTKRALIRLALADKIERDLLPLANIPRSVEGYPNRLRLARRTGSYGIEAKTGRLVPFWDRKAGLSRLCPDDAREEAMRLARRYQPTLEEWTSKSPAHRVTYMVLTQRNSAPGSLRQGMEKIFRDFRRLLKSGDFPAIKGALAVLEAPLGASGDWNVHLNVLIMHDGFIQWGKLRKRWHWNVHMKQLTRAPGAIGAALRELIKYAVAAVASKSEEKACADKNHVPNTPADRGDSGLSAHVFRAGADGGIPAALSAGGAVHRDDLREPRAADERPAAPALLDWSPQRFREWLVEGMRGFRRTRSYGLLYDIERPKPEPLGRIVHVGQIWWRGDHYEHRLVLLDSILEDKSALDEGPQDRRTAWPRLLQRLALGSLERYPEVMSINDIYVAKEKNPNWDRDPPRS